MVLFYNIPVCIRCTSRDIKEVILSDEQAKEFRARCMSRKITWEEMRLMHLPKNYEDEENRKIAYEGLKEYYLHITNSLKKVINV